MGAARASVIAELSPLLWAQVEMAVSSGQGAVLGVFQGEVEGRALICTTEPSVSRGVTCPASLCSPAPRPGPTPSAARSQRLPNWTPVQASVQSDNVLV